ncbi:MAG: class I SAM-dependent methyltransferase [Planctomycetes bacterium]|nr:class I SAM-dependent methyltransferase [Planctomycetota bacterium]
MANAKWEFQDEKKARLALGVFGVEGGETDDEAVVRSRHARLSEISSRLALTKNDRAIDLGSGMGYLAEVVAPRVKSLVCVDISPSFLEQAKARHERKGVANVEYVLTEYADFSKHVVQKATKIYSLLLFIHFNFYDFLYYLVECNRVLEVGGQVYLDFNDGDRFKLHDPADSFNTHIPLYKPNRVNWIFGCMHMGSLTMLRNLAPQIGFQIDATWFGTTAFTQVLLRKTGEAPDLGGG